MKSFTAKTTLSIGVTHQNGYVSSQRRNPNSLISTRRRSLRPQVGHTENGHPSRTLIPVPNVSRSRLCAWKTSSSGLIARVAMFVSFAALIALLIIFAKPLSQFAIGLFDSHSERADAKTDRAPVRTPAPEQRAPASSSLCSDGTDRGCICGEHTRYRPASAIRRHSAAAARRAATGGTIKSCATARTGITAFE